MSIVTDGLTVSNCVAPLQVCLLKNVILTIVSHEK